MGISVVRIGYKPLGMVLDRYTLDEGQRKAFLLFKYKDEVIRYTVYMNDSDSSTGQKELDKLTDEYDYKVNEEIIARVEEYELENSDKRYIAEYEYQGVHYQLKGVMEKQELEKILDDLKFL